MLGAPRIRLLLDSTLPLAERPRAAFVRLVRRRGLREPLQHIVGRQEFFSREFWVDASVLVPRPESEILVEEAVRVASPIPKPRIVDLGSGSGVLAVTLALELPGARLVATDISPAALRTGHENARRLGVADRIEFLHGDWLAPCAGRRFDLVVSNPPYVPRAEIGALAPEVRDHEPRLALDGGADGCDAYRRLAASLGDALDPGGAAIVEIGRGQRAAVTDVFAAKGFGVSAVRRDLAGIERVLTLGRGGGLGGG